MRIKSLSTDYYDLSGKVFYSFHKEYGSKINFLTTDESNRSSKELERLYQEILEDNFLFGKTPEAIPDNWEEDD